jgi:hypothetical protein
MTRRGALRQRRRVDRDDDLGGGVALCDQTDLQPVPARGDLSSARRVVALSARGLERPIARRAGSVLVPAVRADDPTAHAFAPTRPGVGERSRYLPDPAAAP